jgi:hypothetical protein
MRLCSVAGEAMAALFEDGAVLVADDGTRKAHGQEEIAWLAREIWQRNRTHLAEPRRTPTADEVWRRAVPGGDGSAQLLTSVATELGQ